MSNDFGMWLVNQLKEIKTILTEARQTYDLYSQTDYKE